MDPLECGRRVCVGSELQAMSVLGHLPTSKDIVIPLALTTYQNINFVVWKGRWTTLVTPLSHQNTLLPVLTAQVR